MAIIKKGKKGRKRLVLDGVSGHIGRDFVVKQYKGRIVITGFPKKTKKKPTAAQVARRVRFIYAVKTAKKIIANPEQKALYERNLNGKRNAFQAALSEILNRDKAKESKKKP
jgi:hypothetical protein